MRCLLKFLVLFGDKEMAKCILASDKPLEQKRFGRKVRNFNVKTWAQKCQDIVADGNYLKVRKTILTRSKKVFESISWIQPYSIIKTCNGTHSKSHILSYGIQSLK